MTKTRLGVLFSLSFVLLFSWMFFRSHETLAKERKEVMIPKSYGTFKAVIAGSGGKDVLVFEDSNGTIRIVTMSDASVLATYVRE